jgi:hypothetical protein
MLAFDNVSERLFGEGGTVGRVRADHGPGMWRGLSDYVDSSQVDCDLFFCLIHLTEQDLPRKIHWLVDRSKLSSYTRHVRHLARWPPQFHDRSWRAQKQLWIVDGEQRWTDKFEAAYIDKGTGWRRRVSGFYNHSNSIEGRIKLCCTKMYVKLQWQKVSPHVPGIRNIPF